MSTKIVIIGAYGSAGVAVADKLSEASDVSLTLVDDGDPGGGLCILRGCMPSKEVISAGAHRFQARHDDRLPDPPPTVDIDEVVAKKDEHTANFAAHRRAAAERLADRENVEFVHDTARFVDERTVQVGEREIEADYVVVATGSTVNLPDTPGMDDIEFTTSADVLDATDFPDSGIVMGFGYVGLELVPYLAEVGGMDLTVIEHDGRPLDEADPAYGEEILDLYRREFGVEILTNTDEKRVEATADGGVRMTVERDGNTEEIRADQLFVFTGRQPDLDGLGLENTNIEPGSGWVADTMQAVDEARVFVVGDANGKEPLLHVAKEQGLTAAKNLLAHRAGEVPTTYENVHHHVIFSGLGVYPYARVGHSESSATDADLDYVAVSRRASEDNVFTTKDASEGLATLVVDGTDGTVLGYQGLHYHADVMAKMMQVAVEMALDVRELPDRAYHPTTPEILDGLIRDAADALESR